MKKVRNRKPHWIFAFIGCFCCATIFLLPIGIPVLGYMAWRYWNHSKSKEYHEEVRRLYQ